MEVQKNRWEEVEVLQRGLGDSKYCERHRHRGERCLTKSAEMPLLTSPSYNSCSHISSSSSSYNSPPLALRLGSPYHSLTRTTCTPMDRRMQIRRSRTAALYLELISSWKNQQVRLARTEKGKARSFNLASLTRGTTRGWSQGRSVPPSSQFLSLSEVISSFSPFSSCFMFSSLLKIQV